MPPTSRKQKDGYWCSAHFLLFVQSGTSARGMASPTFRVGLHTSVNLF